MGKNTGFGYTYRLLERLWIVEMGTNVGMGTGCGYG